MNLFLAALILGTGAYIFSYFWFGRFGFKKIYEEYLEKSNRALPHPRPFIFILFYAALFLVMSLLGYFISHTGTKLFLDGVRMGMYLWIFYAVIELSNALFNRVNPVVVFISWGYWLLVLVLCGGFFTLML